MKVRPEYCTTKYQIADSFTKLLPEPGFELLRVMLRVTEFALKRSIKE